MFATTSPGGQSTPSEEIVVFEELEEVEELDQGKAEQDVEEEQNIGKHILDGGKVVEAQTEYNVAVFKRLLGDTTKFISDFNSVKLFFQDGHRED